MALATAVTLLAFAWGAASGAASRGAAHGLGRTAPRASSVSADEGTNRGGLSRDGWYPEASELTPANVTHDGFGPLFSLPVTGQVYAQPVVDGTK